MLDLEPLYKQVHLHFHGLGRIEALLLTSFGLDVRYLEERILPSFFPELGEGPASEPHRPLFEYLEEHPIPISVMFDTNNLLHRDGVAHPRSSVLKELRWQAHPMRGRNGCFHYKLILALVSGDDGNRSLVVGCGSANLTQPGWGTNLEACVLRTISLYDAVQDSMLVDVLELLDDLARRVDNSEALDRLRRAIAAVKPQPHRTRSYGVNYRPRLWHAGMGLSLSDFLKSIFRRDLLRSSADWRLEVLSPYYSKSRSSLFNWVRSQLSAGAGGVPPVLCCCPQVDGQFDIDPLVAKAHEVPGEIAWSTLPTSVTRSKLKGESGEAQSRFLHAKVYRFWCSQVEVFVCGSANATRQGCRDDNNGNDEACIIFSRTAPVGRPLKAWLRPLDEPIDAADCRTDPSVAEDEPKSDGMPQFRAIFDWKRHSLVLDSMSKLRLRVAFNGQTRPLAELDPRGNKTLTLTEEQVGAIFRSPSLWVTEVDKADARWIYLVEETNLYAKPPAPSMERTADELIQDWQQGFDERIADRVARIEQPVEWRSTSEHNDDLNLEAQVDRLNDVFLAFWRFRKDMAELLGPDMRPDDFARTRLQARIFGQGAMSLRYFVKRLQDAAELEPIAERPPFDAVDLYVSLLTVSTALDQLSDRLNQAGFATELIKLVKELGSVKGAARNRVLNELENGGSAYHPNALLQWVDTNFRDQSEVRPSST